MFLLGITTVLWGGASEEKLSSWEKLGAFKRYQGADSGLG